MRDYKGTMTMLAIVLNFLNLVVFGVERKAFVSSNLQNGCPAQWFPTWGQRSYSSRR